jgi:Leucine-rich repeat (LRR) protein
LSLSHSQITDAGIDYLKRMRSLKELFLDDTQISDEGMRRLQSQSHPKLETLVLEGTRVTDKGLFYVGRMTTLRNLSINDKTTDAGLKNLLPLTRLENLGVGNNNRITDGGMSYVGQLSQLTALDIGSDQVTDAGLTNLRQLKRLFNLSLRCRQMSDSGMAGLKDIKHLGSLHIDSDRISGAGFASLPKAGGMNALVVRGNGVRDEGLEHLRGIDFIGELSLPSDKITDAGLAVFEGMQIYRIDVGGSKITDAGLEHLQHVYGLHSLNLSRNTIKGPGLRYLKALPTHYRPREVLPKFNTLYLRNATDAALKEIAEVPSMTDLILIDPKCSDAGYAYLKKLTELEHLCVSSGTNQWDSDECVDRVQEILGNSDPNRKPMIADWYRDEKPDTDQLGGASQEPPEQGPMDFWQPPPHWLAERNTPDDLKKLRHNPETTYLDFSNSQVSDADLDSLREMPSLETLALDGTQITDAGLRRLQQQLHPKLTRLWIAGTRVTDAGLESIGKMTAMSDLALGNQITDAGLHKLLPLKHLEALWLGDNDHITDVGMQCVGRFSGLSAFDVGSRKVSDAGLAQLKDLKQIYDLRLRCPGMTDAGVACLHGLRQLASLQLESDQLTDAGMATLRDFPRLAALELRGNRITGVGLPHFLSFPDLRHLAIRGERIGDEAIKHLKRNHELYSLTLYGNDITDAGLAAIKGQTISELRIGGARLTDAGLEQIRHIDMLRRLDLFDFSVRGTGLRCLKDMVKDRTGLNTGIQDLYLRDASDEALKQVAELPTLQRLFLADPKCTDAGYASLNKKSLPLDLQIACPWDERETRKYLEHVQTILPGWRLTGFYRAKEPRPYRPDDRKLGMPDAFDRNEVPLPQQNGQGLTDYQWDGPNRTDADLKKIEDHPDIQALSLVNSRVTDAGLRSLRGNKGLKTLELDGTQITDDGMAHLESLDQLVCLRLASTRITDAGLQHLRGMKGLAYLALDKTRITDAGLRTLALQSHPHLAGIDLTGTRVTDAGMGYVGQFTELSELTLNDQITDDGLKKLLPLKRLNTLLTGRDEHISDLGMGYIGQFSGLTALSIESNRITDAGLANFKKLMSLRSLSLGGDLVTDAGMAHLAGLRDLYFLKLHCGRITDAGLRNLKGMPDAERHFMLNVRSDLITGDGLAGMRVSQLALAGDKVTDNGLKRINDIHGLTSLNLLGGNIRGSGLRYLKNSSISALYLRGGTDEGMSAAAEMSNLHQLFLLRPRCTDGGYEALKGKRPLQVFIAAGNDKAAPEQEVEHVQALLPNCDVYTWLPDVWDIPPP